MSPSQPCHPGRWLMGLRGTLHVTQIGELTDNHFIQKGRKLFSEKTAAREQAMMLGAFCRKSPCRFFPKNLGSWERGLSRSNAFGST